MRLAKGYKTLSVLGKFSISFPVGFSAFVGYVVATHSFDLNGVAVFLGIFLLSAAASLFNQVQERDIDALMLRTSGRPLPTHSIELLQAVLIGIGMSILGGLLLFFVNVYALLFGFLGMFWYNLIYTPLKRVTSFSVFPGAVVGAVPPIAGWMGGGGELMDDKIVLLAFFFFIGQMPHFWLLVIKYGEQYSKAGLPSLTKLFSVSQIMRINMVWLWASFVSALFFPLVKLMFGQGVSMVHVGLTLIMMVWALVITFFDARMPESKIRQMFLYFNTYYLFVMLLLLLDVYLH